MEKKSVGKVLRIIRIANDLSIMELSRKVGISNTYISELERGKKQGTTKTLEKILQYYNLNIYYLESLVKYYNDIKVDDLKKYQLTMIKVLNTMLEI